MEVKRGYKQTDLGVIPEEWNVKQLKTISPRISGRLVYQPAQYFTSDGVPFLMANNITELGIDWENTKHIPKEINNRFAQHALRKGDIVTIRVGSPGVTCVVPAEADGLNCGSLMIVRQHPSFDSNWLSYAMNSPIGLRQVANVQYGTAQKQINITHAVDFCYPVPSLGEQRAIATALSDVDALLSGLDRLIAKNRDLKQATMQQLLTGKTRLPGFCDTWALTSLDCIVTRSIGVWGNDDQDATHCRKAEIIRAGDISPEGKLMATASRFVSDSEFAKGRCELDDLVITTSGNGLGKVWWCDGRADVVASNFVRILRPNVANVSGRFLSYVLRTGEALRQLQEHTATSAYPNLRPTFFSATWIPLPKVPEQVSIAMVLSDIDAERAALEHRLAKTRALKQAMMQELLTGKSRLIWSEIQRNT